MSERAVRIGRWSLEGLIPASKGPEMERVFQDLNTTAGRLESIRGELNPDIAVERFVEILELVEEITYRTSQLKGYTALWLSEHTSDQAALAFHGRVDATLADVRNRTLFFELWWKQLDAQNAYRLLDESGDARYYLETLRRFAPFTLSEPEEKVVNIKDVNGVDGMVTLYNMITNAFTFDVEIDGDVKTLTRSEVMVYARDASPDRRRTAYRALYDVYGEHAGVLSQIYKYVAGNWYQEKVALRGIASPIAVRNLINDVPDDVVDLLLDACRENVAVYQRFFQLKAQWLGMDRLRRYDIYAPLEAVEKAYPFTEGIDLVLESMRGFSPTVAELAERVLVENHLDSQPRPGKDTGAFCYGVVPNVTPWVLVNYNATADDVSTLAHELGHAVHAMMAKDHSVLTFHSSLPLAETASNFAELLLLDRLLEVETDPAVRRYLLAKSVDDSYVSILRQSFFTLYERDAHKLIRDGEATSERLADRYLDHLKQQFGDSVALSEEFRWEWVSVPHFYETPFYCYAYAFGLLLVLALFQRYREQGTSFVPEYLRILAYGGSQAPMAVLDEAGVNVRSKAFWQGGFDVIAEMVDELEKLTPKLKEREISR
jgi:oligoendopeptidase F